MQLAMTILLMAVVINLYLVARTANIVVANKSRSDLPLEEMQRRLKNLNRVMVISNIQITLSLIIVGLVIFAVVHSYVYGTFYVGR